MSRLVKIILTPPTEEPASGHPSSEDLARLAEGAVKGEERRRLVGHVNQCQRCFQVLSGTMADLEVSETKPQSWWTRNATQLMAVAASLIMVVMVGHSLLNMDSAQDDLTVRTLPKEERVEGERAAPGKPPDKKGAVAQKRSFEPMAAKPAGRVGAQPAPTMKFRMEQAPIAAAPRPTRSRAPAASSAPSRPALPKASFPFDLELRKLVLQGSQQDWRDPNTITRLVVELRKRGLRVGLVRKVVMTQRYTMSEAMPARAEVLLVSVEGDVIYLQVKVARP